MTKQERETKLAEILRKMERLSRSELEDLILFLDRLEAEHDGDEK